MAPGWIVFRLRPGLSRIGSGSHHQQACRPTWRCGGRDGRPCTVPYAPGIRVRASRSRVVSSGSSAVKGLACHESQLPCRAQATVPGHGRHHQEVDDADPELAAGAQSVGDTF
jgi:hypothetical protein